MVIPKRLENGEEETHEYGGTLSELKEGKQRRELARDEGTEGFFHLSFCHGYNS
ncbi:uncharacterized protein G2W53_000653 [Senna tora]|uniref:Uncharacterized protein n=1 Tax=Senna tora TaxID=362788 RepID=A0A834XIA6_9FABA|nr:uncharacterized protein G2W53_000653 [Senna tora]